MLVPNLKEGKEIHLLKGTNMAIVHIIASQE
jgi:hypothetical protein